MTKERASMRSRQSVSLTALRSRRQEAVARHHYMMGSRAVVIFLHYWSKRPAGKSASGFKAALDQPGNKRDGKPRTGVYLRQGTGGGFHSDSAASVAPGHS